MNTDTDIDIDFADRTTALLHVPHVGAMMKKDGKRSPHTGVYLQNVPVDPVNGLCAFAFDEAGQHGYFKVDFLNNSIYESVKDEDHLHELMNRDVPWEFFLDRHIVSQLAHIRDHFGIVQSVAPTCIEDLAVILALIRPGKRSFAYKPRKIIDENVWKRNEDNGYVFKRSHAISFAVSIVVQLQLLIEKAVADLERERDILSC